MATEQPTILHASDVQAAIEAGRASIHIISKAEAPDTVPAAVIPSGSKIELLKRDKLERPRFLTAAPVFHEPGAFAEYVEDFRDKGTRIWFDFKSGSFKAVFDYHLHIVRRITPDATDWPVPRHGDHVATLVLRRSPEWEAWAGHNEKQMSQQQFAEFLEDNAADLVEPDPSVMMDVATNLNATTAATFKQARNLANGSLAVVWDEAVNGTIGSTQREVPTHFVIGIRPFYGTDRYPIDCRLRYRVVSGELRLFYKAMRLDQITETVVEAVAAELLGKTAIKPALGAWSAEAHRAGV